MIAHSCRMSSEICCGAGTAPSWGCHPPTSISIDQSLLCRTLLPLSCLSGSWVQDGSCGICSVRHSPQGKPECRHVLRASRGVDICQQHAPHLWRQHATSEAPLDGCALGSMPSFSLEPTASHVLAAREKSQKDAGWSYPRASRGTAALPDATTTGTIHTTA